MRRTLATIVLGAAAVAAPCAASARTAAALDGGSVVFFADTLALVARDGASLTLADGTRARADAAYVDLKKDIVVLAGHAHVERGAASADADAVAVEIDSERVDLLDAATGVSRTTRALGPASPADFDAQRFAFPDVDDRGAFIRSKHAKITPHADVRFTPAAFPTSVGGVPVPSYLYTYATAAGFSASSLPGATFDQPYGLWGSPTSLTALHARYESGPGIALGLQQHIVSGDTAFVTASIDAPFRGYAVRSVTAYKQLGSRYTMSADGTSTIYGSVAHVGMTAAIGAAGSGLDYTRDSGGGSRFTANLHSPDRPLVAGATWRVGGTFGFDAQRGGLLSQVSDRGNYSTVWRHGLNLFVSGPNLRPLGTPIVTTLVAARTWYSFPHYSDTLGGNATASHPLMRNVTLFAGYQGLWSADVYPNAQALFYPTPSSPLLLPDGTPYYGYAAFTGASTLRSQNADLVFTPNGNTSLRLSVVHTADFPQYRGFGRPQWEARTDVRFRPFPNIGLDIGRAYDFAWGGTRWLPRWSFAITP